MLLTGLGNNSVSLIAGVAVLSTVFALSDSTAEGLEAVESGSSGLTFIHLTALFASMGTAGWIIGSIFFPCNVIRSINFDGFYVPSVCSQFR